MTRILVQRGSGGSSSSTNRPDRSGPSSSAPAQAPVITSEGEIVEEVQEKDLVDEFSGNSGSLDSKVLQGDDDILVQSDKPDDEIVASEKVGENDVLDSGDLTKGFGGLSIVEEENEGLSGCSFHTGTGTSYPPPPPVPPPKPSSGNLNPRRIISGSTNATRIGSSRRAAAWPVVSTRTSPTGSRPTSPRSHCENEGYNSADEQSPCFGSSYDDAERERQFEIDLRRAKGLEVKRMLEDGNCLFRAVADQVYGDSELYDLVRQMCIDYMERERDHFSQFITEGFTSYCKRKRRDKVYGNNVEIQALCEMFNRPIHIYSYSAEPINIFHGSYSTDTPPIRLSYHHGNHYNSLVDPRRLTVGAGLGFSSLQGTNVDKDQVKAAIKAQQDQQIDNALLAEGRFYSDLELTEKEMERMVMEASRAEYLADDKFKQQLGHRESSTSAAGAEPSSSGARPSGSETKVERGLPGTVLSSSMQMVLSMGFSYLQALEAYSIFGAAASNLSSLYSSAAPGPLPLCWMAKQLYGYNTASYGGAAASNLSSLYSSANQYLAGGYLASDPYSSAYSSAYSSITDRTSSMLYGHSDSRSSWPGPPGVDVGSSAASVDPLTGLKRSSAETLYHQTALGSQNTIGQSEAWFTANYLAKRPRFDGASNLPIYPQRPGEKDCAHYMLTRTCKFGESCKFDHPIWVPEGGIPDWKEVPLNVTSETLPERPGEPDCPYFLKTQRCKFGPRCKFNHPKDKIAPLAALESAGIAVLPERPYEPPCAFYTKTGNCKFGATCKFHHPKDIVIPSAEAVTNENLMTVQPFSPALLHNSKGLPVRPGEVDCPFYLKTGSCKYGSTCRYNHPDRYAINPPAAGAAFVASPASHLNLGVVNPAVSIMQSIDPRLTQATLGLGPSFYPQRPGQLECDFYMKSGECKFGERCKYHHPIDRLAQTLLAKEALQENVKLTLAGLPRREGAIHCPYYMKTGACKYGAACKFDHPPPGEVMTTTQETSAQENEAETAQE